MKNGFYYKTIRMFLMFWMLLVGQLHAQPNLAFYPLNDQFNSFEYNPAFLTSREKFTFSIFPLAGTSLSLNNQEIIIDMVPKVLSDVITTKDYEEVLNQVFDDPSFYQKAETSLLSFTYRSKKGIFNFRIQERQYVATSLRGELMDFFRLDNQHLALGKEQNLPIDGSHLREYSLGYSRTSKDKRLSSGIRAKIYFGKLHFSSDLHGSINRLSEGGYGLITSGMAYISFPGNMIKSVSGGSDVVDFSSINDYIWNSGNLGVGIDLGLKYQLRENLSVSASLIDLGKITWKNNISSRMMDREYALDISDYSVENGIIIKPDATRYRDILDFSDIPIDRTSFAKALPAHVFAGISYQVNPQLSLSIQDRYTIIKHLNYNSISFTANVDINPKFSLSTGYAIIDGAYFNIPLALMHTGNFGQVYLGTDNLVSFVSPTTVDFAALSFGACFYLFTHRNLLLKRDENIPFYQPRKTIKNKGSGFIIKARKKD